MCIACTAAPSLYQLLRIFLHICATRRNERVYLRMQTGSRHAQSRRDGSLAACRCACCLLMFMLRHGTWAAPRLACESRHELGVSFVRRAARSTSTTAIHVSLSRGSPRVRVASGRSARAALRSRLGSRAISPARAPEAERSPPWRERYDVKGFNARPRAKYIYRLYMRVACVSPLPVGGRAVPRRLAAARRAAAPPGPRRARPRRSALASARRRRS